ncbi:OmpA family protein [Pseudopelagicola sp. nBUS_20]|uniref:OmpA family protein n=1 Tax=Pseudopelagicola sp. nBUS_20 TaxID=3395317 RepID=UPI003EB83577
MLKFCVSVLSFVITASWAVSSMAQNAPFASGWKLENEASQLQFQSIKNQTKIETSSFATMEGGINSEGLATIKVLLDSVDTKVDLRNVRMRFLFFETFEYPELVVTARIDPSQISDLEIVKRKTINLPFSLSLHGVSKNMQAQLSLTLIGDDLVAVSTAEPINVSVADFDLTGGLEKLQEAANVSIVPSSSVNFDFIFRRLDGASTPQTQAAEATALKPASAALEAEGDFSLEACVGRFEILSRSGNIYFKTGSSQLDAASTPLLNTVADIVTRCPDLSIQIGGHTDSIGGSNANQRLSERRAASVVKFLTAKGIAASRMQSVGFGEDQPIAANDTKKGRSRNRRIEFTVPEK